MRSMRWYLEQWRNDMARDKQQPVDAKDAPPNGYAKTDKSPKGPHRSDPDFGQDASMSNPKTVKPER
jgi:hypothetical protein